MQLVQSPRSAGADTGIAGAPNTSPEIPLEFFMTGAMMKIDWIFSRGTQA
jgi:hypothetical protein